MTITGVNNKVDAPDKSVTVSAMVSGGNGVSPPSDVTLTITDNDSAPSEITLSLSPFIVSESAGATPFTVTATLNGRTTFASSKSVTVKVGASEDSATEGTDYATVADVTLTIAAGTISGTASFSIDPTQDAVYEGILETVSVSGTLAGVTVTGTTFIIAEDDAAPTVTLSLSSSSISENGGTTNVTASLSGVSSAAVTVTVSASPVTPRRKRRLHTRRQQDTNHRGGVHCECGNGDDHRCGQQRGRAGQEHHGVGDGEQLEQGERAVGCDADHKGRRRGVAEPRPAWPKKWGSHSPSPTESPKSRSRHLPLGVLRTTATADISSLRSFLIREGSIIGSIYASGPIGRMEATNVASYIGYWER